MFCPHCGADVLPGNASCQRCRKSIGPPRPAARPEAPAVPPAPTPFVTPLSPAVAGVAARPGGVTLIAALGIAFGGLGLLLAVVMLLGAATTHSDTAMMLVLAAAFALFGALQLGAGLGLWKLKAWGRSWQLALSWIGVLGIPCGTLVSVPILVYLYKPHVKALFAGAASAPPG